MTAFDPKKSKVDKTLKHNAPLLTCRFHPAGTHVFATSEDRSIVRFEVDKDAKVAFPGHDSWGFALAFTDAGKAVVSGGGDGMLIWHSALDPQPKAIRKVNAHDGWIRCLATNQDGSVIASGGNDFLVKLWAADGKPIATLNGHKTRVYSLLFHPDGKHLLSGDLHGHVKWWDYKAGKEVASIHAKELHTYEGGQMVDYGGIRGLAFSPDNKHLACCGLYKATNPLGNVSEPLLLTFDTEKRQKVKQHVAEGLNSICWRVQFLSDGTAVGACGGTMGGHLVFWSNAQDKDVHRFQLPNIVRNMDLHPKGNTIATAHHDGAVRIVSLA